MKGIIYLDIENFRRLCYDLAQAQLSFNEPIPDYESAFEEEVESILLQPRQTFDNKSLYPSLEEKAGIIFYLFIKNHPFSNGNKRVGLMTLIAFLALNGKWLNAELVQVLNLALDVAKSKSENKNKILKKVQKFIKQNTIKFE